jgi:hypothetical protein
VNPMNREQDRIQAVHEGAGHELHVAKSSALAGWCREERMKKAVKELGFFVPGE